MGPRWRRWWLLGFLCVARAASAGEPVWPLEAPPVLTSSFGEPRQTHLHAGIDLGTGGRIGVPCRAVGDGWVARLRMSPFGYGKAVYLQLDTGHLVVYAHLDRFAAPIAARAWQEQTQRGLYTFDITLPSQSLRVRRGEVVAWSGDTGIGSPHLHFEVRDGDVALNPQSVGFALRDVVPPRIQGVQIMPLDPTSHVEGDLAPLAFQAAAVPAPLRAAGRLGFAVRAIDRAAPGSNTQVPHTYEARLDGRVLFRAVHESFDYAVNHQIVLDYDQEQLVHAGRRYFLLYARAGNRLPGREPGSAGRGAVVAGIPEAAGLEDPSLVAPGKHVLEIEVSDVAGQTDRVQVSFLASHVPVVESLQVAVEGDSLRVACAGADADGDSLSAELSLTQDQGRTWRALTPQRAEPTNSWFATLPWKNGTPVVCRARLRDPSGLKGLGTAAPAAPAAPGGFGLRIEPTWRYGRLELAIATDVLLAAPPRLVLRQRGGRSLEAQRVRQQELRRWIWAGQVDDVEDLDAVQVSASAADGRHAILRQELPVRLVRRGQVRTVDDLHPLVRLEFERDTLFESIALRLRDVEPSRLGLGAELHAAGACVLVEPRTAALDRAVRVVVRAPDTVAAAAPAGQLGLFMVGPSGELASLDAERNAAGELVATTRRLGTIAVLRDATPPQLLAFRAVPRHGRPPRLQFVVRDGGAGIGDGAVQVQIDGTLAIPEWDPESGQVLVHPTATIGSGRHRLEVVAVDRLGNRSAQTWEFAAP